MRGVSLIVDGLTDALDPRRNGRLLLVARRRGHRPHAGGDPAPVEVIQTVREKFSCRAYEKIGQPPAPVHATPRGWAGPNLLAIIVFEKYGKLQPLNRQRDRYAREGVDLNLSTLANGRPGASG